MRQNMQATGRQPGKTDNRSMESARQVSEVADVELNVRALAREQLKDTALRNALRKRASGVPTYKVPEAAALLSLSHEYLYRLIHADAFPALRMGSRSNKGRFVVPAKAVDYILERATSAGACVDVAELAAEWRTSTSGGAA